MVIWVAYLLLRKPYRIQELSSTEHGANLINRMSYLYISSQPQNLMIINEETQDLHMKKSSGTIIASSTEPKTAHDNYVTDLPTEPSSTMVNPAQKSTLVSGTERVLGELSITSLKKQDKLMLGEVAGSDLNLSNKITFYGCQQSFPDNESELAFSSRPRPLQRRSHNCSRCLESWAVTTIFGTIHIKSIAVGNCGACSRNDRSLPHSIKTERETNLILHPTNWLVWLGMKTGLDGTFSKTGLDGTFSKGWKTTLRPFCAVPDNALIFEFCKNGNIDGIRTLLVRGDASLWDRNSGGQTPLHVSPLFSTIWSFLGFCEFSLYCPFIYFR